MNMLKLINYKLKKHMKLRQNLKQLFTLVSISIITHIMFKMKKRKLIMLEIVLLKGHDHLGDNNRKRYFTGLMVNKLIKCCMGVIPFDDRDSYVNKRFETPGCLSWKSNISMYFT